MSQIEILGAGGARKYLCGTETIRFLASARGTEAINFLFCAVLAFTGCRISEALAITPRSIDFELGHIVFRTLKRRKECYRTVPLPADLMRALVSLTQGLGDDARIWPWCRQTAWRRVKTIMAAAGITGLHAAPKGLRHGFGVTNAESNVPMATTQRWLGHARLETTAIYQQVNGREERALAGRVWEALSGVSADGKD